MNHELRGRLAQVDTSFWTLQELKQIALAGFPKLNAEISDELATRLAREACGSPQLMQRICLDVCFDLGLEVELSNRKKIEFDEPRLQSILEKSSTHTDFGTMLANMHQGPKTRGSERRVHKLIDGTEGDVYRVLLLAIAYGDPVMTLPYPVLMDRIQAVCVGDQPTGGSVVQACYQLDVIARRVAPNERVLEWDSADLTGTINIVNPYFLFFLRASRNLYKLGTKK